MNRVLASVQVNGQRAHISNAYDPPLHIVENLHPTNLIFSFNRLSKAVKFGHFCDQSTFETNKSIICVLSFIQRYLITPIISSDSQDPSS